jgi:GDPmannose 4,6-dehydratase
MSDIKKTALITGITGQDGSYLAELLLEKGYAVHGMKRRTSTPTTGRIDHLLGRFGDTSFTLHHGDVTDTAGIMQLLGRLRPDELYNLAGQSHVAVSFETPVATANATALGPLRILEALRTLDLARKTRFYQASTSELYGNGGHPILNEDTPFCPCSPYAAAKLYAYWITRNYRDAYNMFACNGIFFNHESPRRGETFVTRKITRGLARVSRGMEDRLELGNLDARRDWGHARDYVEMMWLMLQQDRPDDYVVATGVNRTVREFVEAAARELGMNIAWQGTGPDETGIDTATGRTVVSVSTRFYRPTDVDTITGDASKARERLGWAPRTSFREMVREMVAADLADMK